MAYANLSEPASGSTAPSLSDATVHPPSRGVRFSAAGTVHLGFVDGTEGTWDVLQGEVVPVRVTKVFSTGTDAGMAGKVHLLY